MITSIDQLIFQIHNDRKETTFEASRKPRTKWTAQEEQLFEHLVASYGNDYSLLRSFLPGKNEKQIRKKYRQLLRYRSGRLDRLEKEISMARRKDYFDRVLQEDLSSCEVRSHSSSPDESSLSSQRGWLWPWPTSAYNIICRTIKGQGWGIGPDSNSSKSNNSTKRPSFCANSAGARSVLTKTT